MKAINDIEEWKKIRRQIPDNKTIGFVATMGCLHEGHAELIKRSVTENDITVMSIYVNPAQFNDPSDLDNYPITIDDDLNMAKELDVDFVFMPTKESMYPCDNHIHFNAIDPLATIFEGEYRPGHFNGMLTIVMKLLLLIVPARAYFGEKDYQQYYLIDQLAKSYFLDVEVVPCDTVRVDDVLPLSSRNKRLNAEEHQQARNYFSYLKNNLDKAPVELKAELMSRGYQIEYLDRYQGRLFTAVKIGLVRLLDNLVLQKN